MNQEKEFIKVNVEGETYLIEKTNSLLQELTKAGVPLNKGCLRGVCGVCRAKCHKGTVSYTKKVTYPLSQGEVITCIGKAESDLELELIF